MLTRNVRSRGKSSREYILHVGVRSTQPMQKLMLCRAAVQRPLQRLNPRNDASACIRFPAASRSRLKK